MVREVGVALLSVVTAGVLTACGLLSGVDDLHLKNTGDATTVVVRGDASTIAMNPSMEPDSGANDAGEGDGAENADADASPAFMAMGAGDAAQGRPGFDAVVGGDFLKSPHYTLLLSVGEAPGGNGVMVSSSHRFVGGVVGTTQQ